MANRQMFWLTSTLGAAGALSLLIGLGSSRGILAKAHAEESSQGNKECSLATLQGDYLVNVREDFPDRPPAVVVGVTTFDGEGHTFLDITISDGVVIQRRVHGTGVYTLDADCAGTMLNGGVRNWDIFFTRDGSEGVATRTDEGLIATQTLKKR